MSPMFSTISSEQCGSILYCELTNEMFGHFFFQWAFDRGNIISVGLKTYQFHFVVLG